MTRPNLEELDRLHGEASKGSWTHDMLWMRRTIDAYPDLAAYVRELEVKVKGSQGAAGLAGNVSIDRNRENKRLRARLAELESENRELRDALDQACDCAEEMVDRLGPHYPMPRGGRLETMRTNRTKLLGKPEDGRTG